MELTALIITLLTLVVTSFYNHKTYKHSKEQIDNNKMQFEEQLSIAKSQFSEQHKASLIQQFETTLFNMIKLQQEITEGLRLLEARGRETFQHFFERDCLVLNYHFDESPKSGWQIIKEKGINGYEEINQLPMFDHYFRHLYNIFKFIDESDFLDNSTQYIDKRYRYARIVRATLSPHELVLVFYNCRSKYGNGPFKSFVEKYSVLNNLRADFLHYSPFDDDIAFDEIGNDYNRFQTTDKNKVNEFVYYSSAFEKDTSLFKYN
jgi:hypothetical protein